VLPTATWYEKNDLNTSDMHPFIHPLTAAVDPAWESRTDWDIYKGIAKTFSKVCEGTWASRRTWSPCRTCTTPRPNWPSRST
jgi:nitrate reductase alpha subunit